MPISKKLTEKREEILRIARLIRSAQMKPGTVNDLNDLYGAGKGIYKKENFYADCQRRND